MITHDRLWSCFNLLRIWYNLSTLGCHNVSYQYQTRFLGYYHLLVLTMFLFILTCSVYLNKSAGSVCIHCPDIRNHACTHSCLSCSVRVWCEWVLWWLLLSRRNWCGSASLWVETQRCGHRVRRVFGSTWILRCSGK